MVKAEDLINAQKQRDRHKEIFYKKIYKKVETKIMQSSAMNLYECWYLLPEFLFNIPLYDLEGCKNYLETKLKRDGFSIYFPNINTIVISWLK